MHKYDKLGMTTGATYAQKWLVKYKLSNREFSSVKAAPQHVNEIDTRGRFHHRPTSSFNVRRSQKRKIQLSCKYLFTL